MGTDSTAIRYNDTVLPGFYGKVISRLLKRLTIGCLTIIDNGQHVQFGCPDADLQATIEVHQHRFYQRVCKGGSIGGAEAYMEGDWDTPDLVAVVRLMAANLSVLDNVERRWVPIKRWLSRIQHQLLRKNSVTGSRRNIQVHYDLGNDFYQLLLDPSMMYSSAVFEPAEATLEQASYTKIRRLLEALALKPGDSLLEIGTGWGTLAIIAARDYGVKVTTTTLSEQQYLYAQQRVAEAGLTGSISLLKQDYRQLTGQYDHIVSVEMIEAVGAAFLPQYFHRCNALLKPGGRLALQAITIRDQRHDSYRHSVDFIQKYIFPGGYLPSLSELMTTLKDHSQLAVRWLDDIGLHYAETLRHWRNNFEQHLPHIRALGYDERFIRMWRYYLCYCEGGFREKTIATVQLLAEKDTHVAERA